jgi:processive 1,2-diacylglycerol beta-glucosyltransferase
MEDSMYNLYQDDSGELLGKLSYYQLQWLRSRMEEESLEDKDYSITPLELVYFETEGVDTELLEMLRKALGDKEEVIVRWTKVETT